MDSIEIMEILKKENDNYISIRNEVKERIKSKGLNNYDAQSLWNMIRINMYLETKNDKFKNANLYVYGFHKIHSFLSDEEYSECIKLLDKFLPE